MKEDLQLSALSREQSAYSRSLQVVEAMVCRPLSGLSGRKSANHQPGPRNPLTAGGQPVSDSCAPAYSRRLQGLKPKTQYLKPERSALGCRPQSAVSREPSAYGRSLEGLKPNTHYLIPKRSAYRRSLQALLALKPNTQYLIPFIIFIFVSCDAAMAQEPLPAPAAEAVIITGTVVSAETGEPLEGATVKVKGTSMSTLTNRHGEFILAVENRVGEIEVSFLGYSKKAVSFIDDNQVLVVSLEEDYGVLEEVNVSTGYQEIAKDRATGSFVFLDSAVLNRSVSTNVLERLDGVASGLIINKGLSGASNNSFLTIRGRSTIFGNPDALIVLDGFPYDGDIGMINPNDVESISILKDAAAASIWGTRSGNGVIVITTKSGEMNRKTTVGVSSLLSISGEPDLFYKPRLSSADFIEQEQFLFERGYYNSSLNMDYRPVSEVVEMLWKVREGKMDRQEADSRIETLKNQDIRNDMQDLMYRRKAVQQYQLNVAGGSDINKFYISGGFDQTLENLKPNQNSRTSFDAKNTLYLFNNKFELYSGLNYTSTKNYSAFPYSPYSAYDRLVDEQGNSLPTVRDFKLGYIDTVGAGRLLDWHYRPMDELNADLITKFNQTRLNFSGSYWLLPELSVTGSYQFLRGHTVGERIRDIDKYHTRNLINRYSYFSDGELIRPIAVGAIAENSSRIFDSEIIRLQVKLNKIYGSHEVNGVLGYEGSEYRFNSNSQTLYGYDASTLTNTNATIDPTYRYLHYYGGSSLIPTAPSMSETVNIGQSYYGNVNYGYKKKYIVSASFRRDESNLFGVKSNQRGVPLWSTGLSWNLHEEDFYNLDVLPYLKLRLTYGYNGNVDKSLSGYLTVRLRALNELGNPFADIENPPNPALRWEKVKTWNAGTDFSLIGQVMSGSIDVYKKEGIDLIGNSPLPPQTGVTQFKGNNSNTKTTGVDVVLNTRNIDRKFKWNSNLLVNYSDETITNYKVRQSNNFDIVSGNYRNPLEGYPYYALFSYPSAGLDNTGMPQGYLNGEISNDYNSIYRSVDSDELNFHGSSIPRLFGSLRNTFSYKGLELSFNLSFKSLYYFRRAQVFSGGVYGFNYAEYENRWKQVGDELNTRIPALIYPANSASNVFFQYSDDLVEKGDHIRLQDIRISHQLRNSSLRTIGITSLQIFGYANNLGTIWKSNKKGIDPDHWFSDYKPPVDISLGINLQF